MRAHVQRVQSQMSGPTVGKSRSWKDAERRLWEERDDTSQKSYLDPRQVTNLIIKGVYWQATEEFREMKKRPHGGQEPELCGTT